MRGRSGAEVVHGSPTLGWRRSPRIGSHLLVERALPAGSYLLPRHGFFGWDRVTLVNEMDTCRSRSARELRQPSQPWRDTSGGGRAVRSASRNVSNDRRRQRWRSHPLVVSHNVSWSARHDLQIEHEPLSLAINLCVFRGASQMGRARHEAAADLHGPDGGPTRSSGAWRTGPVRVEYQMATSPAKNRHRRAA